MNEKSSKVLAAIIGGVIALPLRGLAISLNWYWFVAPLGVPEIGIFHALGLTILVDLIAHNPYVKEEYRTELVERLGIAVFEPIVMIGVGWGIHRIMVS